jgi:hypothetical protein
MAELTDSERVFLRAQQGSEQLGEALRTVFAPAVAAYFTALVDAGVPADIAGLLVLQVQEGLLAPLFRDREE